MPLPSPLFQKQIETILVKNLSRVTAPLTVCAIVALLLMMILPLPGWLLDFFLGANLVGVLAILLVSVFITHPMKFSSFPSLLLIATLFRLGLNLASTRLILSRGEAGTIIRTFGEFTTGGSLTVGFLMFLIMTVIQFVVVTKGSERVAEVSARFTLDALPGRQMSIDADLRAGLISQEEARNQRRELQTESKMYGALDGAMKFVKGDAIASLIITFINILGGLFTGISSQGLTLAEAAETYSILTIGDGLVTQIPSILMAITSGFVVTRVPIENREMSLGTHMGLEIFSQPAALAAASVIAFLMGFLPGFPTRLFALFAFILALGSLWIVFHVHKKLGSPPAMKTHLLQENEESTFLTGRSVPLLLQVGSGLRRIFMEDKRWILFFNALYPKLRFQLSRRMGISYPEIKVEVLDSLGGSFHYHLKIYDVLADTGVLVPHHLMLYHPGESLAQALQETPFEEMTTFHGTRALVVSPGERETLLGKGFSPLAPEEVLLRHLARVLIQRTANFVGIQEVKNLLSQLEISAPDLVREIVPKMISVQKLTEIVSRLVEEGIPVRDFRMILTTIANSQPEGKDPVVLTEQARLALHGTITLLYAGPEKKLLVLTCHETLEDEIRSAIQKHGNECYLALEPGRVESIHNGLKKALSPQEQLPIPHVILTHAEIRRYLRKLIEPVYPDLAVLSYQEIDPDVILHPCGTLQFCD